MLLAEVVATSMLVSSTPARSAKIAALAELFARLPADEVEAAVAWVAGTPRQGRVGVGWATMMAVEPLVAQLLVAQPGASGPNAPEPSLTVRELDSAVSELQAQSGPGSASRRGAVLAKLMTRATAAEADFIRRLLLGELRQGALEGVVADGVARAAGVTPNTVRRAAMLAGDLPRVAEVAFASGERGLAGVGLDVLRPVQPMLASTASSVADALQAIGPSSVEWKLDGARIQAHRRGGAVRLFTRNLNDITDRLPGVVETVVALPAERFILDGEVIGVGNGERPELFQDTMSRFGRQRGGAIDLGVWWFDCLHLDGGDLIDRPFHERRVALEALAGALAVPSTVTDDPSVAQAFLEATVASGHEGVMVKSLASRYEAGRRGQAWRKVKPVRTLDLVVLAAEWGHGRRRGWLSNLHLGARHPAGNFVMVGKTFKGLTDELLTWQTARLQELEVAREGIVVRVRPELVVEVALDGVQVSSRYPGGVALRFARVRGYRSDKSPSEADDIDVVRAMLPRQAHRTGPGQD